jgi:septal ring factor EnvC (AmiA/AmiB activator)
MDYDKVASALLIQVVQNLTKAPRRGENDGSWSRRRMQRLERRVDELERELSQSKAESKILGAERDELRLRLEHSEGNLALLTERLATSKPREGHLSKLLDADERALLHQLRGGTANQHQDRASFAKA